MVTYPGAGDGSDHKKEGLASPALNRQTPPVLSSEQSQVRFLGKVYFEQSMGEKDEAGTPPLMPGPSELLWDAPDSVVQEEARESCAVYGELLSEELGALDDSKGPEGSRTGSPLGVSVTHGAQVSLEPSPPPMTEPPHLQKSGATDRRGVSRSEVRNALHSCSLAKVSDEYAHPFLLPPPTSAKHTHTHPSLQVPAIGKGANFSVDLKLDV